MSKGNRSIWNPRCEICGKFVSYDKVISEFTPDTDWSVEKTEFFHLECRYPDPEERALYIENCQQAEKKHNEH